MRETYSFYPWIMPSAPACAEPTADIHIIGAAREFCEATRCWREKDVLPVSGCEDEIACVPPYATLMEIEAASFGGQMLERVAFLSARLDQQGQPHQITQMQPNSIAIAPRPQSAGCLSISMFLKPAQNADVLPDFLYEQFGETIAQGALARICAIPNQPFSNPSLATYNAALFTSAKDAGFNLNRRGQQRAPVRSVSRYF